MKKLFTPTSFFVKTAVFFVYVRLVHFLTKLCFASNLIWSKKFFKTRTSFFVKTAVFSFISFFLIVPTPLIAQTSEFTIRTLVGDDTIPPTTPTLLSVVPMAQTQIDITWGASTDNFFLDGYVLLRDGSPIATTTLTTYIDTGLTASTTYLYEVYAFDSFSNISTTSNSLATTTLAVPVITPTSAPTSTASVATRVLRLLNLDITPSTNSAIFSWRTTVGARYALRWGRNDAYDEGYILNDIYRTEHRTLVGELEPGTVYLYELIGYSNNGIAISLKNGQFKTEARENLTPANVQNLQAVVSGNNVDLNWSTDQSLPTPTIRVVRSHLGYPSDIYDGAVVFEGKANSFFDKDALLFYQSQFYTVFAISSDGSVSSGAVVKAKKALPASASSSEPLPLGEDLIEILDFGFSVENINLNQGDRSFNFKDEELYLLDNEAFIISIPYTTLPDNLKSIVVTLLDPADHKRSYSFLLRINKDRTAYEAVIAPLKVTGPSRLQVEIFDYEREIIGRYRTQVNFIKPKIESSAVVFPDKIIQIIEPVFFIGGMILIAMALIFFLLHRRSRKTEDNH